MRFNFCGICLMIKPKAVTPIMVKLRVSNSLRSVVLKMAHNLIKPKLYSAGVSCKILKNAFYKLSFFFFYVSHASSYIKIELKKFIRKQSFGFARYFRTQRRKKIKYKCILLTRFFFKQLSGFFISSYFHFDS